MARSLGAALGQGWLRPAAQPPLLLLLRHADARPVSRNPYAAAARLRKP